MFQLQVLCLSLFIDILSTTLSCPKTTIISNVSLASLQPCPVPEGSRSLGHLFGLTASALCERLKGLAKT